MTSDSSGWRRFDPEHRATWLRRFATSPLLGWIPVVAVMLGMTIYGLLRDDVVLCAFLGLAITCVTFNLCVLIAAGMTGHTRQLRPCWLSLVAAFLALFAVDLVWPGSSLGHGLDMFYWAGLFALGFPASLLSLLVFLLPYMKSSPLLGAVVESLLLVGLAYLQSFVLLPLLFRWRARYE